jgi:hypothetical protein
LRFVLPLTGGGFVPCVSSIVSADMSCQGCASCDLQCCSSCRSGERFNWREISLIRRGHVEALNQPAKTPHWRIRAPHAFVHSPPSTQAAYTRPPQVTYSKAETSCPVQVGSNSPEVGHSDALCKL